MQSGQPDRPPLFDEGQREEVLAAWRHQGMPDGATLAELFAIDERDEIEPDLYPSTDLQSWPTKLDALGALEIALNPDDPARLPEDWDARVRAWRDRQQTVMLRVHRGFFQSIGIQDWRRFYQMMFLVKDEPRLVRGMLEIQGAVKSFDDFLAVNEAALQVQKGEIVAVIGPNGAGKTTLFNLVSGFVTPDAGEVRFDDRPIQGLPPFHAAALGLSRTFQNIKLFSGMTALENVMVGRHVRSKAGFVSSMLHLPRTWSEEREVRQRSLELMEFLGIGALADAEATSLAYGQQRAVELARALACEPRMVLLDEPAAGLNMRETAELSRLIVRIRDRGITVLLVEHDMSLVMGISDEVVVLSYGEKIAEADPGTVQKDPQVIRIYLGEEEC